eukprot:PITA_10196
MSKDEERSTPCSLPLPLSSLNHVSLLCKSVPVSTEFYENVLGFHVVRRPPSFDFVGVWLFNYGVGIHLLQCKSLDDLPKKTEINPRDNHISFQCPDMFLAEKRLQEMNIKYKKRVVEDGGLYVDQLFFHDPDGNMIEICNCENLPVIPVRSPSAVRSTSLRLSLPQPNPKLEREDSLSEIALVPVNVATPAMDFTPLKKEIEATAPGSRYSSDALDDKKLFFLDIMDFFL